MPLAVCKLLDLQPAVKICQAPSVGWLVASVSPGNAVTGVPTYSHHQSQTRGNASVHNATASAC